MPNSDPLTEDIDRFLDIIWLPNEVRELRIPHYNKYNSTASGYFDNPEILTQAAASWDSKANLYITLNPVNPDLLARASNRIEKRAKHTTSDTDIQKRHWLYLDIDPVRPSGVSSTESERGAAQVTLISVTDFLRRSGWPKPVTVMSGNGYYALYRIDLDNTPENTILIKSILDTLADQFNTSSVHIDTTVYNPSRIAAVIGTLKCKGDSTPERPHRRSQLVSNPDSVGVVEDELLRALASQCSRPSQTYAGSDFERGESLQDILDQHSIEYRIQPPDARGFTWYHVRQCPFHDDGRPFECGVGQKLPDGPFAGKCFHPEGGGKGWQDWKRSLGLSISFGKQSSTAQQNSSTPHEETSLRLTDTWNARRLVTDHQGDILWCEVFKKWFINDGTRYAYDQTREVERLAECTVTNLYKYAGTFPTSDERRKMADWATKSESHHRITNMIESAKRMVPVHPTEFDTGPYLFNVLNGTIDLRTQRLLNHRKEDRLTKRTEVIFDPTANCPQWISFLNRIFEGNLAIISFVQRLFGYCLTGILTEHIIVILWGTGANGKSTLLHVLRSLAGDYSHHCRPEVFTAKRNDSQGFELVPLVGARVVTASETGAGRRLDEALVKEMTGGEPISCAPKYGSFFTFQPAFKPLLATNHKPEIRGADEGIWRRVLLLPFTVTIPESERDPKLSAKLDSELSGILNWALQGVEEFLRTGLAAPDEVRVATANYRAEQDILAGWIEECCTLNAEVSDEYAALYQDYTAWCERTKEEPVSKARFSSSLEERGCPAHRGSKGKRLRMGIARRIKRGDG